MVERWQSTDIAQEPPVPVEPEGEPAQAVDNVAEVSDPDFEETDKPAGVDTTPVFPAERPVVEVEAPAPPPASPASATALEEGDDERSERSTSGPYEAVASLLETERPTAEAGSPSDGVTSADDDVDPIDRGEDRVADDQRSTDPTVLAERVPVSPTPTPTARDDVEIASSDAEATVPGPTAQTTEAEPADGVEQAELPSRIRQALQVAAAEQAEVVANGGTDSAGSAEPVTAARPFHVQLAAVDDEIAGMVFWREVNERLPGVFTDIDPIFSPVEGGEGTFLRVWVGVFDSLGEASSYCDGLKEQGQDCFVTRSDTL